MTKASKVTPLMKQYNDIKSKYPDAILLFRVGDFYETFGDDAVVASKVLGIVLTKRGAGSTSETELAGFPHHSIGNYLPKLVKSGYRVAICDQLEDPKLAKKIVKRGVTEIVTPGVALTDGVLEQKENNYLASICFLKDKCGISFIDVSTGDFYLAEGSVKLADQLLTNYAPKEILVPKPSKKIFQESFDKEHNSFFLDDWVFEESYAKNKLLTHFNTKSLKGFGIVSQDLAQIAAGAIIHYLNDTEHNQLSHINRIQKIYPDDYVWMDRFTIRNLELFNSNSPGGYNLADTIDGTITPMGSRKIKNWIAFPLVKEKEIKKRQDLVKSLVNNENISETLKYNFDDIIDIERVMTKIATYRVNPRELVQLGDSLNKVSEIKKVLESSKSKDLKSFGKKISRTKKYIDLIAKTLNKEAPVQISKGNVIINNFSKQLDELRSIHESGKEYLDQILERETEKTKIPSLKISFNNVFGYYIEVRNTHKDKVPEEWIRKQTLVNAERYITEELKSYEEKILTAEEKIKVLENKIYIELLDKLQKSLIDLKNIASCISELDVLNSFSEQAMKFNYTCPKISKDQIIKIKNGRHPVIERNVPHGESYVPNSILLDKKQQIIMITGPNMSGKSAILRQTALLTLLSQIGSFVPAEEMTFGLVDRIFTRVGASDNLAGGESTFLVEMNEAANILNNATRKSLILFDEVGRGTATFDGLSIAWAIVEYLHDNEQINARTLFATHYHELSVLESKLSRLFNYHVEVKEYDDDIIFLRKIIEGPGDKSYGIQVAKMAGLPSSVVERAKEILFHKFENNDKIIQHLDEKQDVNFKEKNDDNIQLKMELEKLQTNDITPIEALNILNDIKKKYNI